MDDIAKLLMGVLPIIIPVIAIIGGITLAIVRVLGQQRLAELERRERIAAIERGLDPSKLPPVSNPYAYDNGYALGSRSRRAHGLFIGGLIVTAVGISMLVGLSVMEEHGHSWVIGTMPLAVGIALLIAAKVVWPKGETK